MKTNEYDITTGGYYWRGKENLVAVEKLRTKPNLFYAGWEFRCCIERILFEHLALLKVEGLSKSFEKLYRAKDIRREILEMEPEFYEKLKFMNIFFEALSMPDRVFIPDLDILNSIYGKLGSYLHSQKRPEDTVNDDGWWESFLSVVKETDEYINSITGHGFGSFELNERGLEIFKQWQNGEISKNDVIRIVKKDIGQGS